MLLIVGLLLVPRGIVVNFIAIDASELEVEHQSGIGRNGCCRRMLRITIAQIIGDIDHPTVTFVHVHEGSRDAYDVLIDAEDGRYVCLGIQGVATVALAETIALWVLDRRNQSPRIMDAD